MQIKLTLTIDVGDDPTADGITYMIYQYGEARGDDAHAPEEWAEQVVLDVVGDLITENLAGEHLDWRILDSTVEALS